MLLHHYANQNHSKLEVEDNTMIYIHVDYTHQALTEEKSLEIYIATAK